MADQSMNSLTFWEPDRSTDEYKIRHSRQSAHIGTRYSRIGYGLHPSNVDTFDLTCGLNQQYCRLENPGCNDLEREPPPEWIDRRPWYTVGQDQQSQGYQPGAYGHGMYPNYPLPNERPPNAPASNNNFDLHCGLDGEFCSGRKPKEPGPMKDARTFGHEGWMTVSSYSRSSDSGGPMIRTETFPKPQQYGWRPGPIRRSTGTEDFDFTDDFPLDSLETDPDKVLDVLSGAKTYDQLYPRSPLQRKLYWPDDSPMYYGHGPSLPPGAVAPRHNMYAFPMFMGEHQLGRPSNGLAGPQGV